MAALAWPLIVLVLALMFYRPLRVLLSGIPRWVKSIKGAGIEIELNKEAVKELRSHFNQAFSELITDAHEEYKQAIEIYRVDEKLQRIITEEVPRLLGGSLKPGTEVRGTVYVPDIVFKDYLYQVTNYWPITAGAKAGRRFSQRYGIIGRCWRLRESIGKGEVMSSSLGEAAIKHALLSEWGMISSEALVTRAKPAYLCVILQNADGHHGLLYIDSPLKDAFGDDIAAQSVANALESAPMLGELTSLVSKALHPLREVGLFLEIAQWK